MHDLLTDARFQWKGARNFVILDPAALPAHLFSRRQPGDVRARGVTP